MIYGVLHTWQDPHRLVRHMTPVTTETLASILAGKQLPDGVWHEAMAGLGTVEEVVGAAVGNETNPLLLSVRSGAEVRMNIALHGAKPTRPSF